ncbi:MAG TPA: DUF58 domain-containing protein [Terriglobia bacterium]|nr:DUF58 domain-containing protein [Terriglobia bacterium]
MIRKVMEGLLVRILADASRSRSMWKSFLQSIGALSVALIAALYSSSVAAEGRVIAASVAAMLSLAIAVWVAWRFVPRLARGVDWDWIPFLSGYHVTRDGWIYFGALAVVVSAAINTNNNLLYMVLAALVSVLVISVFLSALNLRQVEFEAQVPARCFAGEAFPMTIIVRNHKRVFPTLSLFTESFSGGGTMALADGEPPLYFALAKPRGRTTEVRSVILAKRGRFAVGPVRAVSRFPFGFLMRARLFPTEAEGVAYPALLEPEEARLGFPDARGESRRFARGFGYELHAIRDYIPSDSARSVHWKASAKTATLKTREYALDEEPRAVFWFDRFGDPSDPAAAAAFERLVSRAASLAFYLIRDGYEVSFQSDEWKSSGAASESLLESILTYLALVEMSPATPAPEVGVESGILVFSLRSAAL